jgi:hypothetical protein
MHAPHLHTDVRTYSPTCVRSYMTYVRTYAHRCARTFVRTYLFMPYARVHMCMHAYARTLCTYMIPMVLDMLAGTFVSCCLQDYVHDARRM